MHTVHLLVGSNMGNPQVMLEQAADLIIEQGDVEITTRSSLYQTAAWGKQDQPDFLNQALELQTLLSPKDLLSKILAIEIRMGRRRFQKNDPRIIDLDIIFYDDLVMQTDELIIPHPLMQQRRFVLTPLSEIAPQMVHPILQKTVKQLLDICPDILHVKKFSVAL